MARAKNLYRHAREGTFVARRHAELLANDPRFVEREPPAASDREHAWWLELAILQRLYIDTESARERQRIALDFEKSVRGDTSGFDARFPPGALFDWSWTPEEGFTFTTRPDNGLDCHGKPMRRAGGGAWEAAVG